MGKNSWLKSSGLCVDRIKKKGDFNEYHLVGACRGQ